MKENHEQNNSPESSKNKEAVKMVFERLSNKIGGKDLLFKDEQGDSKFLVMLNPAGNLSIHDYGSGNDYPVWKDGEIEALSTSEPEKNVDTPSAERLVEIADKVEGLKSEELEKFE